MDASGHLEFVPLAVAVHPKSCVHRLKQVRHEVAQLREGVIDHPRQRLPTHGAEGIACIKGHNNS
eukprot:1925137-Prorocentrum_lima.AAC.1